MIRFETENGKLYVDYMPDFGVSFFEETIKKRGEYLLKHVFRLTKKNVVSVGEEEIRFLLGKKEGAYIKLDRDVLMTDHDIYIDETISLSQKFFIANQNISIFSHIDRIIKSDFYLDRDDSAIDASNHLPLSVFRLLLKDFPTTSELKRYSDNRISLILQEYFDGLEVYQKRYEKRLPPPVKPAPSKINLKKLEMLVLARDSLKEMLHHYESYSEADWQTRIQPIVCAIFPKYVFALREISIGKSDAKEKRPDFLLIDGNGYVDLMEIKKPDSTQILRESKNRNNYVPQKLFTDVVVQTSKYLLTMSENAHSVIKNIGNKLNQTDAGYLEGDFHINNPQAIILCGRSDKLNAEQISDFELIKRQYKDIPEIMTYDDLLKRFDNIIRRLSDEEANADNRKGLNKSSPPFLLPFESYDCDGD